MSESITINKLELASELASNKLESEWVESIKIYEDDDAEVLTYTEEAQDIFNEYYDYYCDMIERCAIVREETADHISYNLDSNHVLHVTHKGSKLEFGNVFTESDINKILNLLK